MLHTQDLSSGWEFSSDHLPFVPVTLPHVAFPEPETIECPRRGTCTYRLRFFAKKEWSGKIVQVEIGAAMQVSRIFLNDRYLFTHFGGYQRFFIPLSEHLVYGEENILRLELDNNPSDDFPPGKEVAELDFCYYSGLYRGARLLVNDRLRITDELEVSIEAGGGVFVRTESLEAGKATVSLSCHVLDDVPPQEHWEYLGMEASPDAASIRVTFLADDGRVLAVKESDGVRLKPMGDATLRVEAEIENPPLWTTDSPRICRAVVELIRAGEVADRREVPFGIRTISFDRDGFYLNGVKTPLIGTNRHMDYPFVGNALPVNAQRRDAAMIKRGGYNFVRLSHYNHHPAFIRACDELGLLVMAPIPGWQYFALNEHFVNHCYRDARELVRSLRNNPSVILWEVSLNESYPPSWINEELHRIAHREYPGPQCYTCGDAVGNYEGWDVLFFHDKLEDNSKPVIIREYGDWAFGGGESTSRRTRGDGMTELLRQAWNFQWTLNLAGSIEGVVGTADWCFIDYNRGCESRRETSGSVDVFRYPKPKFYFYRSQGASETVLYPFRDGNRVIVYSNCEEVEILRDGKTVAPRRGPDDGPDTPYNPNSSPGWETAQLWAADTSGGNPYDGGNGRHLPHPPYAFRGIPDGQLEVVGYRDGKEAARVNLPVPGAPVGLRVEVRDEGIPPVENDLVFVDAVLVDEQGTLVPMARPVVFEASGCEIVGVSGKSTEAGVASCLVRAGDNGKIEISARLG